MRKPRLAYTVCSLVLLREFQLEPLHRRLLLSQEDVFAVVVGEVMHSNVGSVSARSAIN
jgi:hypothetical protein